MGQILTVRWINDYFENNDDNNYENDDDDDYDDDYDDDGVETLLTFHDLSPKL